MKHSTVTFAHAVRLLMSGPRTTRDLADALGVKMDSAMRYTRVLRSVGLIYAADWTTRGRQGPRMAVWAWQSGAPFATTDMKRPAANDSRKLRRIAREERAARASLVEEPVVVAAVGGAVRRPLPPCSVFDLGSRV